MKNFLDEYSFKKLIKEDKYQVFLLTCPASFPVNFVIHPWFVINRKGVVSRWEVNFWRVETGTKWGHLYKDALPIHQGMRMIAFSNLFWWKARLIASIEGDEHSLAARMAEFIVRSNELYSQSYIYSLIGNNSNTYVQWVINHFPEAHMKLPWNSLGKYKAANIPLINRV